ILMLGIDRGELSSTLNIELSLALLLGPMIYWHVFQKGPGEEGCVAGREGARITRASRSAGIRQLATGVVDAFWRAFALNTDSSVSHPPGQRKIEHQRFMAESRVEKTNPT
ncbi:MAG TPA: hypothetical protein VG168_10235, partial [Bryobacteraceae bacterium]|nr:hypothetical protein [Bryobacteraceae bacterium]